MVPPIVSKFEVIVEFKHWSDDKLKVFDCKNFKPNAKTYAIFIHDILEEKYLEDFRETSHSA